MVLSPRVKVCGLTRLQDAVAALDAGADRIGMIFYPGSPRYITAAKAQGLLTIIPPDKRTAVMVMPTASVLAGLKALGFRYFQIHCASDTPVRQLAEWRDIVGPEHLWLAPRLKPGERFPRAFLRWAESFLIDSYSERHYGGSGRVGDWFRFRGLQREFSGKMWILAGGLTPDNIAKALEVSQARFVDVNSGVESVPGVKAAGKIRALFQVLRKSPSPWCSTQSG